MNSTAKRLKEQIHMLPENGPAQPARARRRRRTGDHEHPGSSVGRRQIRPPPLQPQ